MSNQSIAVGFARRQTPESSFGHFAGTEETLVSIVAARMSDAIPVNEARTILRVPVAPEGFWSAVRPLRPGDVLKSVCEPRCPGEEPVIRTVTTGSKSPARHVEVILYHRDALGKDASTDAEWEVVSINPSPFDGPVPMDPTTMARNQLRKEGGTFQREYSSDEWARAVWFWSTHANVSPTSG